MTWTTLTWSAATPATTSVKLQIAAGNSASGPFAFVGPDGTAATFFTTSGASLAQFNGRRYLKYTAFLATTDTSVTPSLDSVTLVITAASGCSAGNSADISIQTSTPAPTITAGGPTTFCPGDSVVLTSSDATGNQWYLNGVAIAGAVNQNYSATAAGDYTVTFTSGGCSSFPSASATITLKTQPAAPFVSTGGATTFC